MDEPRALLERLERIAVLDRAGAPSSELLDELRGLVGEVERHVGRSVREVGTAPTPTGAAPDTRGAPLAHR